MVSTPLIDRERELSTLDGLAAAPQAQLVFVSGRRRVGKTYLLQAFGERHRTVYHTATQQSAPIELATFTDTVRASLGPTGLPAGYVFPDWSAALDFVADLAGDGRLVVVLDEFPYLAGSTPGIESIVQRWWDRRSRDSSIMLVLCGSAVAYMEQIGGAAAPLHQRATATIHVAAMDYRAAGRFVPSLAPADRAVVYGILGGTPLYLAQWDANESLRANLLRLFGHPASPLVDAAELILSRELPELENASRILQAVAIGKTRQSAIADYARVAVERPLKRLAMLGLLERRVPALDDPARSKRAIYRVADPYFTFWFRFIAGHRAHIARGLGARLVDNLILPGLDDYMGGVFEDVAREHARHLAGAGELDADRVDAWWSADGQHEIDLVGLAGHRIGFVGEAKWSARPPSSGVLARLEEHVAALPGASPTTPRLLYGRGGCAPGLASRSGVRCFSAADLYAS
ncbi:MAG: ATP-binding protein [Candidatus Limnocylindrales bacterium]